MTGSLPRVANAPCSWGVIGGGTIETPWERMLDELVRAGYHGTELGDPGFLPSDPQLFSSALTSRGLTLLGAFRNAPLLDPEGVNAALPDLMQSARLLAAAGDPIRPPDLILCDDPGSDPQRLARAGRVRPEDGINEAELRTFCTQAERIAREVRAATGLRTLFHPHAASRIETPDEMERLLNGTDPKLLGIVFDTGHVAFGAGPTDPDASEVPALLRRFAARAPYLHLKDLDPAVASRVRSGELTYHAAVAAGLFPELGQGAIDFAAVVRVLHEIGYDDWVTVEQDVLPNTGTPFESARRNRAFLAEAGL